MLHAHYCALGYFPQRSNSVLSCTATITPRYSIVLCFYHTALPKQPSRTVSRLCGIFR
ncbi:hypothetical protein T07_4168 [Trichinella nelsoni]|uniref:Uncharacterized protein n=1 Tax=Trichinella nelsoni TaxID=6336 RepID=A0A0V0RDA5_9BILA|nr:hypothetical protein T07_4168 [Trichinella nelsoni]